MKPNFKMRIIQSRDIKYTISYSRIQRRYNESFVMHITSERTLLTILNCAQLINVITQKAKNSLILKLQLFKP